MKFTQNFTLTKDYTQSLIIRHKKKDVNHVTT